LVLF